MFASLTLQWVESDTERGGPTVEIKRKVVDRDGSLEEEEGGGSEVKEPQLWAGSTSEATPVPREEEKCPVVRPTSVPPWSHATLRVKEEWLLIKNGTYNFFSPF